MTYFTNNNEDHGANFANFEVEIEVRISKLDKRGSVSIHVVCHYSYLHSLTQLIKSHTIHDKEVTKFCHDKVIENLQDPFENICA